MTVNCVVWMKSSSRSRKRSGGFARRFAKASCVRCCHRRKRSPVREPSFSPRTRPGEHASPGQISNSAQRLLSLLLATTHRARPEQDGVAGKQFRVIECRKYGQKAVTEEIKDAYGGQHGPPPLKGFEKGGGLALDKNSFFVHNSH